MILCNFLAFFTTFYDCLHPPDFRSQVEPEEDEDDENESQVEQGETYADEKVLHFVYMKLLYFIMAVKSRSKTFLVVSCKNGNICINSSNVNHP